MPGFSPGFETSESIFDRTFSILIFVFADIEQWYQIHYHRKSLQAFFAVEGIFFRAIGGKNFQFHFIHSFAVRAGNSHFRLSFRFEKQHDDYFFGFRLLQRSMSFRSRLLVSSESIFKSLAMPGVL